MLMKSFAGAASVTLMCLCGAFATSAQAADPIHVRGTIAAVDGNNVTLKTNEGKDLRLMLDDSWKIGGVIPATMADIKQGTFIGTANMEGPDGNKALEVVVFPEALRGTGEGNYGWDLKPKSSMTNATVQQSVESVNGPTVTLKYKDGEKKVMIPPSTPIVSITSASKDDIKPGAKVFVVGTPGTDGMFTGGGRIVVGKNGITPPM